MKTTTTKQLNLTQLAAELGVGISRRGDEVEAHADITKAQLDDAIAAHVPNPDYGLSAEQKRKKELAAKSSLTAQETAEAIKLYLKGV